ncbi:MBOAT family O-acyltransferase [Bradyrhizobium sp. NP1]|uniref:MBOAT family O-acyltransferase n=1 Tax=Bradyrhizobium sp. NP1 TaxID=3049772 RepID=UPI0025A4F8D2|nr:MBOAT family O-acyltransferase [Bradyrhizobium sp. NP1]WJR81225.1 MBOAT family O-acyltransferase [Bradyrhizobium sp. NP1]
MLFSSFTFVFQFLPATILAFAAARRHSPRAGIMVLVGASLVFYGAWRPVYLLLFLASVLANFSLGLAMDDPARRRVVGMTGVALNLSLLCFFKYTNFLLDNLRMVSGASLPFADIVLPLGISFFTFQQIAYLVDVMRGAKVERDIVSYTLFVSFFPHLIAGPLVHHAEMIPQFKRGRTGRSALLAARGSAIFAAGLFKKVFIADNLAQFANPVFAHVDGGGAVTASWAWLATLAYTLQIYFDFSGYSDMAIGLALMFGIRLPVNFRSPYKATSIIDFWRRWHITLSRFLRDYLYIPLGGNRRGASRRYANLMLTMLLGGLWHGAGWNFLVWGGLHGAYLCVNHVWLMWRPERKHRPSPTWTGRAFGWTLTFIAVVVAWVFFRARTMAGAGQLLCGLGGVAARGDAYVSPGILRVMDLPLMVGAERLLLIGWGAALVALAFALLLPNVPQIFRYHEYRRGPESTALVRWRPNLAWAVLTAAAFVVSLLGMWQRVEFLYFQF